MSSSLRLDLRQSQSLVMTPQLQQAIKLLQLGNLELSAYVQAELEENPFLERQEESPDEPAGLPSGERPDERTAEGELSGSLDMTPHQGAAEAWASAPDDGWSEPWPDGAPDRMVVSSLAPIGRGGSVDFGDERFDLEDRLSRPKT
ncbi:MAG: RNA polymerase factor sigma-54, partial [Geminicoccales bacterium]